MLICYNLPSLRNYINKHTYKRNIINHVMSLSVLWHGVSYSKV